jgi:molybdopterin-guanine dinucleotide biosynthesis protein A
MNPNKDVKGLVLAGGKSQRMGKDKSLLTYHNKPQREYLYEQLKPVCDEVYLSIRTGQEDNLPEAMQYILDENTYRGPFNGLLSAHLKFPEAAWLVVACDLPLIDTNALAYLLERRNPSAFATAFATRKTGLPEPLAALWEPHGLKTALEHMKTAESSCPRKFLINTETTLVYPEDDLWLANANEPGDYEELLTKIKEG